MPSRLTLPIVAAALSLVPIALAEDGPGARPYDGHRIVRVHLTSERDLQVIQSLSPDCWCEAEGVGVNDYRVPPENMAALQLSGIDFEILIDNVQARVDGERARLDAAAGGAAAAGVGWFDDFKDFDAIVTRLNGYVALNPDLASLIDIGDSIEGRDIWALRISGPGADKPGILLNATQHAREWIAPMTALYVADTLLGQYGIDPQITALVDELEFFIIPVVNPDGYVYSWGPERYWRKNRRDNGDGSFGVDPNRNWGFEWGGQGASGNPSDPTYYGTGPFSEPETQTMRDFYIANPSIVASIDFHSYGQLVLYPWAYTFGGPGDGGEHALIGEAISDSIFDVHARSYVDGPVGDTLYLAAGGSVDWTWGDQGVISYTIELRGNDFVIAPSEIIPTGEENLAAVLTMSEAAALGVTFGYPSGLPIVLDADAPGTVRVDISPITSGPLDPATARSYQRIAGEAPFTATAMTLLGGNEYEATLAGAPCGANVEFYFEIESTSGSVYVSPSDAPGSYYAAEALVITPSFSDDFEGDQGWTIENVALTDGGWDRGVPAGDGTRGDPITDYDGSGSCYLTDNVAGNSDVDGGPTRLTSAVIDITSLADAQLSYARWFTNDDSDEDRLDVEISNDGGGSWTLVESVVNSGGWSEATFTVSDLVAPTSTMVVRFSATDNPNDSVTEAAVDAVRFYDIGCPGGGIPGDVDGDGDVDFQDLLAMLSAWGPCAGCPADLDGNGIVEFADLLTLLANWTG